MIYGRFGDEITIVSGDIERATVRIRYADNGMEDDAHLAFLRADGGIGEIHDAITAANAAKGREVA